jgi:hypothetical protein
MRRSDTRQPPRAADLRPAGPRPDRRGVCAGLAVRAPGAAQEDRHQHRRAGGAYHYFGERYRDKLAQDGIEVELRPSSGAVENLRRLKTDDSVDVGFLQGGIANEPDSDDLATLGSMYLEPVWVFHRKADARLDRIDQLKGRRIAVGTAGSGAQLFALQLLAANGFATDDPRLVALGGMDAVAALKRGDVEAFLWSARPRRRWWTPSSTRRASACSALPRPTATCGTFPTSSRSRCPAAPSTSAATSRPVTCSCWRPPPTWW